MARGWLGSECVVADSQGGTEPLRSELLIIIAAKRRHVARANYLRLTITAADNLISAGFQCQDTYSYGILVPNTKHLIMKFICNIECPPPTFWGKIGDLNRKILMGRPYEYEYDCTRTRRAPPTGTGLFHSNFFYSTVL